MSIQPLISIEKVIFKILILSFITSSCINKKEVSGNLCTLNLVSENLNKLSVVLSFDNIQILPHPGYAPNLKGKIKHIEEIEYRSVIRYDETIVTPLDTISYVFDKYGNLTEINQKHNITAFQYENNLMTSISDNGRGMSEEDQKHLFQKFFRAGDVKKTTIEGTGLGLFITKELVEKMGGSLAVISELGIGTTFTVAFKRADQETTNVAVVS